ncbi:MAG: bifunctional phosphopantothenoylcysteine decarboxylase/phosphopantothenate--cysteine ligase CoaBC [Chloroherpetonaceae bacterium]|nr:bifunctional phosphopantothenoylcysteine decarboxylase/phosphopantothenate--cysteine ligase CoaBC [Chloroherpetonaceae bacterium]
MAESIQFIDDQKSETLKGRRILLGVSGGIAAYKIPILVRLLMRQGAEVQVLATKNASEFVALQTLEVLSKRKVLTSIFHESSESDSPSDWVSHIKLGEWADIYMIAPATANIIAKIAGGFSDDMISLCALTIRPDRKKIIVPAMDGEMFAAPSLQNNLKKLVDYGFEVIQPEIGELASGLFGVGRMPEPEVLAEFIGEHFRLGLKIKAKSGALAGKKVVVTAGGTRERIDRVRFISNYSSGKMGFALAEAALKHGAEVFLISATKKLPTPNGARFIFADSAEEMLMQSKNHFHDCDLFIGAAAVADYRPETVSSDKIKKSSDVLELKLVKTTDILGEFGKVKKAGQYSIGFALEDTNAKENAVDKLHRKNTDMMVLNRANEADSGFETDTNRVTIFLPNLLRSEPQEIQHPLMTKRKVAELIIETFIETYLTSSKTILPKA